MLKRISWKKGMRLTEDVLRASDDCTASLIGHAFALAGAGRFGLLPSVEPFCISLNVSDRMVNVGALSCKAITKDGQLIDASLDSPVAVMMPETADYDELILTIGIKPGNWREGRDSYYEEPEYVFDWLLPNSSVGNSVVPIARIVNDRGWREDDVDFLPPCLYVSSHRRYQDLLLRFADLLRQTDARVVRLLGKGSHPAMAVFWPIVRQLMIVVDKEQQLLTPQALMGHVQQFISAFVCACDLCRLSTIDNTEAYRSYITEPYHYKNACRRIEEGLRLCAFIGEQVEGLEVASAPAEPHKAESRAMLATPVLEEKDVYECKSPTTRISLFNVERGTTVYFTIDGTQPTAKSMKASVLGGKAELSFDNGYRQENGMEPDKQKRISLIACRGDAWSDVASYVVTLHKCFDFVQVRRV